MLEILKTFDAVGIAMGTHGESKFGSMRHISFLMMTTFGCGNGIDLEDIGSDYHGSALVRVTMPPQIDNVDLIRELQLGEKIRVKGFVCLDTEADGNKKDYIYYGTNIERSY